MTANLFFRSLTGTMLLSLCAGCGTGPGIDEDFELPVPVQPVAARAPRRRGQQGDSLVIANGLDLAPGSPGQGADGQFRGLGHKSFRH